MALDSSDDAQRSPLLTAKQVCETGMFPISYTQLLKLAHMGKVPAFSVPGLGKRVNWWFSLDQLYEFFTRNGGNFNGYDAAQKRPERRLGSGLAGRWK